MKVSVVFYLALTGTWLWEKDCCDAMEDYLWQHQMKKTFCGLIQHKRVYKLEKLDIFCDAKVGFFDQGLCVVQGGNLDRPVDDSCLEAQEVERLTEIRLGLRPSTLPESTPSRPSTTTATTLKR